MINFANEVHQKECYPLLLEIGGFPSWLSVSVPGPPKPRPGPPPGSCVPSQRTQCIREVLAHQCWLQHCLQYIREPSMVSNSISLGEENVMYVESQVFAAIERIKLCCLHSVYSTWVWWDGFLDKNSWFSRKVPRLNSEHLMMVFSLSSFQTPENCWPGFFSVSTPHIWYTVVYVDNTDTHTQKRNEHVKWVISKIVTIWDKPSNPNQPIWDRYSAL